MEMNKKRLLQLLLILSLLLVFLRLVGFIELNFYTAHSNGTQTDMPDDVISETTPLQGHIEGAVKIKIIGLCTVKKAKTLVNEKAFNSMNDYIIKTVSH